MSTITQRKKLSIGTWALIFVCIAALITVIVLSVFGIIDLTFMEELLVGYATFGTQSWINAVITIVIPFAVGAVFMWAAYRYFIGQKVTVAAYGAGGYTPQGQSIGNPQQKDTETVVN